MLFVVEQSINGLQLGVTLFLVAAGLTLVFGVMNVANMAHGSFYMVGAYVFRSAVSWSGSYVLAMLVATTVTCLIGLALELAIMRRLYGRSLLDQVIVTFGVILVVNGIVAVIWGVSSPPLRLPEWILRKRQPRRPRLPDRPPLHHFDRPRLRAPALHLSLADAHGHADPGRSHQQGFPACARSRISAFSIPPCSRWVRRSPALPARRRARLPPSGSAWVRRFSCQSSWSS